MDNIASNTIIEIEEYVKNIPNLSLEELSVDENFKKITIKEFGREGYNVLFSYEFLSLMHKFTQFIGKDEKYFSSVSPNILKILRKVRDSGEDNFGFFPWIDENGFRREKYMFCKDVEILNSILCSINYVDEYDKNLWFANVFEKELEYFKEQREFKNLILVKNNGDVIWTAENNEYLNKNLFLEEINNNNLVNVYNELRKNDEYLGVKFFIEENSNSLNKSQIFVGTHIFSYNNEFLGSLILEIDSKKIIDIIKPVYQNVNSDLLLFEMEHKEVLLVNEKIKSVNLVDVKKLCLKSFENDSDKLIILDEYEGFDKIDNYFLLSNIKDYNWCYVSSSSKDDFNEMLISWDNKVSDELKLVFLNLFVLGVVISIILDLNYKIFRIGGKKK